MSSRIDTLEPNGEPLAVLLASIVARISAHDLAFPAEDNTDDDIVRQAERAVAGIPLGVPRAGHRIDLIASLRLFVAARIAASRPHLQKARETFAAAVPLLRTLVANALARMRQRQRSVVPVRLRAIPSRSVLKIAAGLTAAGLGVALILVQVPGRLARLAPPADAGVPAAQAPGTGASQMTEDRPPREDGLKFTRANLRYCTFQQIRLEALGPITEGADLVVFNALVKDWNGRCTKYHYRAKDKEAVDAEAGRRRALLEVEGRAVMNSWRRKIVTTVQQRPASLLESGEATGAPAAPEPASDAMERLPLLITLGRASADEPDRDSGLSLRAPSLALLRTDVAMRVQRRLNDLGYTVAPVDGTWGTQSRAALRRFKRANGLLGNDAFDAETVTRLFSTSAVTAANADQRDEETATVETVYPPPPAADMNPLNRAEGQRIQQRLAELGYYNGRGDGAWDTASRAALRRFKAANGQNNNEDWNAAAEAVLFDEQAVRATDAGAAAVRTTVAPPAVPLPPKRPASLPKTVEAAAMAERDALRPPGLIPAPARVSGATHASP